MADVTRREIATDAPAVSIGMPVYNGEAFIEAAIASILSQTFTDFELIISDNASTDATEVICRTFAEADPRIRYVRQPANKGAAWNFNEVFHLARGKYFKWAASDDLIEPTFLERCAEILESDPGCVLAHPATVFVDANSEPTDWYIDFLASDSEDPVRRLERWFSRGLGECNPVYGLIRSDMLGKTGLMGDYPGPDHVLLGEIALLGRTRMVREALFLRRFHPAMATRANTDSRAMSAWYLGRPAQRLRFKYLRLILEFSRAIFRADLSARQKARCHRALALWIWYIRRSLIRELMVPLYVNQRPTRFNLWLRSLAGRKRARGGQPVRGENHCAGH